MYHDFQVCRPSTFSRGLAVSPLADSACDPNALRSAQAKLPKIAPIAVIQQDTRQFGQVVTAWNPVPGLAAARVRFDKYQSRDRYI